MDNFTNYKYTLGKNRLGKQTLGNLQYDPRLPAIQPIVAKHWRSMKTQDKYLKECFPGPPLTAFQRQPNLPYMLINSKVPAPIEKYPKRNVKGMTNCGKQCQTCPYILEGKQVNIDLKKSTWKIEEKNFMPVIQHNIFVAMQQVQPKIY